MTAAINYKTIKFIFVSTAHVYGSRYSSSINEDAPSHPITNYVGTKLYTEHLCNIISKVGDFIFISLRLFNVYGPSLSRSPRPTVENIFIDRVKKNLRPIIKSHPLHARDFIHIANVIEAIKYSIHKDISSNTINIGTGVKTSLKELADIIIKIANKELVAVIEQSDELPIELRADTSKANQLLGFDASIPLYKGLLEQYHKE
ncbi:NAD-dependent epimerase/dehydratase family protein [Chloroflexota bacterium]